MSRADSLNPPSTGPVPRIAVAAGVLHDPAGRVLISRRPDGAHMGGHWEFPGGKLDPGEDRLAGLVRELAEEIGVAVEAARLLTELEHTYPERVVELSVWLVTEYRGTPVPREGQGLRWVTLAALAREPDLLPADRPIVTLLGNFADS